MLEELFDQLDRLSAESADIICWSGALARLADADVAELLEDVASNQEHNRRIASESYLHEADFDRLVLGTSPAGRWRLRMNVWWPTKSERLRQSRAYHDHHWDHASLVLCGVLENRFAVPQGGDGWSVHRSKGRGTPSEISDRIGQTSLTEVDTVIVPRATVYSQTHRDIHRIHPQTDFLATLCLQTSSRQEWSTAYLPRQAVKQPALKRPPRAREQRIADAVVRVREARS